MFYAEKRSHTLKNLKKKHTEQGWDHCYKNAFTLFSQLGGISTQLAPKKAKKQQKKDIFNKEL